MSDEIWVVSFPLLITQIHRTNTALYSIEDLKINYEKEVKERKRLFNLVQELRGNIRVFARCRPPSKKELSSGDEQAAICVEFPKEGEMNMKNEKVSALPYATLLALRPF